MRLETVTQKTQQGIDRLSRLGFGQTRVGRNAATPLDAPLGFALLRDPRVAKRDKMRALLTSAGAVTGAMALLTLTARLAGLPGLPERGATWMITGLALASGSALLGALLATRFASKEAVARLRCERYPVIPLRLREPKTASGPTDALADSAVKTARTDATLLNEEAMDPLAALGYSCGAEAPRYAVIPRRSR